MKNRFRLLIAFAVLLFSSIHLSSAFKFLKKVNDNDSKDEDDYKKSEPSTKKSNTPPQPILNKLIPSSRKTKQFPTQLNDYFTDASPYIPSNSTGSESSNIEESNEQNSNSSTLKTISKALNNINTSLKTITAMLKDNKDVNHNQTIPRNIITSTFEGIAANESLNNTTTDKKNSSISNFHVTTICYNVTVNDSSTKIISSENNTYHTPSYLIPPAIIRSEVPTVIISPRRIETYVHPSLSPSPFTPYAAAISQGVIASERMLLPHDLKMDTPMNYYSHAHIITPYYLR